MHPENTKTGLTRMMKKSMGLLEEKHCLHKAHQDDTSSVSKKAASFEIIQNFKKVHMRRFYFWLVHFMSVRFYLASPHLDRFDCRVFVWTYFVDSHFSSSSRCRRRVMIFDCGTPRRYLSHVIKLWHFSSSVNSFFKRACATIQYG